MVRLIESGPRSPVISNRDEAVKALTSWDRELWPRYLQERLRQAFRDEPQPDVQHRIARALAEETPA